MTTGIKYDMPRFGNNMDWEYEVTSPARIKQIQKLIPKIRERIAHRLIFKQFRYDSEVRMLVQCSQEESGAAKERERQMHAIFHLHKDMYPQSRSGDEILQEIAAYHATRGSCEWCASDDKPLVIEHAHEFSVGKYHLGRYRGALCSDCNKKEGKVKNIHDNDGKLKSLMKKFTRQSAEMILCQWVYL